MGRRIRDPNAVIAPFVETYREIFGEGLVSIALYGSAARGTSGRVIPM